MKPSGSKIGLLLACGYPFNGQEWPEQTTGEAAENGTLFHEIVASLINRGIIDATENMAVFEMHPDHAAESVRYLDNLRAEVAYAWDWQTGKARELGVDIGRNYDLRETEIGCSLDITGEVDCRGYVLDWKTGREAPKAAGNGQLLFGAMCLSKVHGWDQIKTCIAHVKPDGQIWRDSFDVDSFDLLAFEAELKAAILAAPTSKPCAGLHCKYCPVLAVCPATLGTITKTDDEYTLSLFDYPAIQSAEHAAWLLHRVDAAIDLLDSVKAKVREYAEKCGGIPLANGKKWGPYVVTRETIDGPRDRLIEAGIPESLIEYSVGKGAVEKYAKDGAEKGQGAAAIRSFMDRLRDAGCVKESTFVKFEARK